MKYIYPAIFADNERDKTSHIEFPSLNYESDIAYLDELDLLRKAAEELSFALWLCEDTGRKIPKPEPINTKALPKETVIRSVSCNYDKQDFSVKTFDISD